MIVHGDCLDVLASMDADSADSFVTDPPYGLAFMGKDWDHGIPGQHFWEEALRVAKPGAHLLAFGGTRTFHRLAVAIEDAGWEIRDTIMWVYGSGFPKSLDVSKQLDKAAGMEREVIGEKPGVSVASEDNLHGGINRGAVGVKQTATLVPVTAPTTDEAKAFDGWGTALKPAWEPIIVARKPLKGTVAANVLEYGTGGLNIDGCRVKFVSDDDKAAAAAAAMRSTADQNANRTAYSDFNNGSASLAPYLANMDKGRWPANVVHDGSDEVLAGFPDTAPSRQGNGWGMTQTGSEYDDAGSASRFFYTAKTSRSERNAGLEGFEERALNWSSGEQNPGSFQSEGTNRNATNIHPCVKPISLMRWLVRLVTPPNGVVVDPFCGSGSTGCAAILEGFRFVGIELEAEYVKIAQARLDFWREHGEDALRIVAEAEAADKERETVKESGQLDMFDLLTAGGNA